MKIRKELGEDFSEEDYKKLAHTLPQSKESEMMVLGCMLESSSSLSIAIDGLAERGFYFLEHKNIFAALKLAFTSDKPADVHLIAESMKDQNKLEKSGGIAYLMTLVQYAGTSAYVEEYVDIVRKKSILRQMINAAIATEKKAYDTTVCLLYTSPSPRDRQKSRMPSSA